jgi:hypothetical protein
MIIYFAQTSTTISNLVNGSGPLILGAFVAVSILSLALWGICVLQLRKPRAERSLIGVLIIHVLLIVATIVQLASLFTITGLSFDFTLIVSTPLSALVGFLVWQQYIYKGLKILPGPTEKRSPRPTSNGKQTIGFK